MKEHKCRICNHSCDCKSFIAREMMFGSKDEFEYFQCTNCSCLQISEVPLNISDYYPLTYYSLKKNQLSRVKLFLKYHRVNYAFYGRGVLGKFLTHRYGPPQQVQWVKDWMKYVDLKFEDSILDVGCGNGQYLIELWNLGFKRITGIDPYIEEDIKYDGVRILKKDITQVNGTYDFVMLHHSFEHMEDPRSIIKHIYRVLAPGQYAIIRIPVVPSSAWQTYSVNWVHLDAPRHIFLHSIKSIDILAKEVGFKVVHIVYDSDAMQFWGSEQYSRGIPLFSPRSYLINPKNSIFTFEDIKSYDARAAELNQKNEGDTACFYLYKQ